MKLRNEPIEINWDAIPENVREVRHSIKIIFYRLIDIVIECLFFIFLLAFAIVDGIKKYNKDKEKKEEAK